MIYGLYHSPGETVGLIGEVIKKLGLPFKTVHLHDGEGLPRDTSDLQGLIVMGGPMNVDEIRAYPFLSPELQLIEKLLAKGKPVLGICLGAQLIAKALGEKVYPNKIKEVGWHPIQMTRHAATDPHFQILPQEPTVLHWHGDTFDLPRGAVHLAKSECCDNQAFRFGSRTYALQFHLEVTPAMTKGWANAASEKEFIKSAGEDPKQIIEGTPKAYAELEPHAKNFFSSYLKMSYSTILAGVS